MATAISALYISRERFFYFWDLGGFQAVAIELANKLEISLPEVLASVKNSLQLEYNLIFALPLIPFIHVFGDTRLVYVLSVSLVYQVGYALALGAIATRMIADSPVGYSRSAVFWSTAFLALLIPIAWVPTLRAYPDVGAAFLIALAIYIYLIDPRLGKFWQVLSIGFLIVAAALFRRHFIYAGFALILAIGLNTANLYLGAARQDKHQAAQDFFRLSLRVLLSAAIVGLVMILAARPFIARLVNTNYLTLYTSYLLPPGEVLWFFFRSYGWLTWAGVLAGFGFGLWKRTLNRSAAYFILLFGFFGLSLWIFLAGQRSTQYVLHASTIVILGLAALIWTIIRQLSDPVRVAALILTGGLILINLFYGLTTWNIPRQLSQPLSEKYAPLVRSDYDEVIRLVAYLRDISQPDEPIYVADSSGLMNFDLIAKAEESLYGRNQRKLNILVTPQIDSRDYFPLEQLLRAKHLIYTLPFQHHLPQDGQRVVKVILEMFAERWGITTDFAPRPETFQLADGGKLTIYQRIQETSPEIAIDTYNQMVEYVDQIPGTQAEWIAIQGPYLPPLNKDSKNRYQAEINLSAEESTTSFLYALPLPESSLLEGSIELSNEACSQAELGYYLTTRDGKRLDGEKQTLNSTPNLGQDFTFQINKGLANNLVFYLRNLPASNSGAQCSTSLRWQLKPLSP